ncbi:hypothetical protein JVU11DRAFT_5940 [Chiua virens]|nr:hypothetical protein JVU11DRAFT_5940 [Chiua virens]
MSMPAPGKYYIVNRVISVTGGPLTLTYDDEVAVVTVAELQDIPTQGRQYYGDRRTQSVSPHYAPHFQIGLGDGVIKVLPPHDYVWTIREREGVYTIQDDDATVFWGLERSINREPVRFGEGAGNTKWDWLLIPAT